MRVGLIFTFVAYISSWGNVSIQETLSLVHLNAVCTKHALALGGQILMQILYRRREEGIITNIWHQSKAREGWRVMLGPNHVD